MFPVHEVAARGYGNHHPFLKNIELTSEKVHYDSKWSLIFKNVYDYNGFIENCEKRFKVYQSIDS